ncbi:MAG: hypothetical protein RLZZ200_1782, partial [Pseudomonadota bacterium]
PPPAVQDYVLTTDADHLHLASRTGADTVIGVQAELTAGNESTYNHGDTIEGNGQTIIDLRMAGGEGRAVQASDIAAVNVELISSGSFEAGGYTDLGLIKVDSGVTGKDLDVHNLQLGTHVAIDGVAATIHTDYQPKDSQVAPVFLGLASADMHESVNGVVDASNNVTVTGENEITVTVSASGDQVELGDVSVTLGNTGDMEVIVTNDTSDATVSVGDISLTAGDSSYALVSIEESGDIQVGNIAITLGDTGSADVTMDANVTGNVTIVEGDNSVANVTIEWDDSPAQDMTVGDITVTMGDTASVSVSVNNYVGGATVGDVGVSAGDDSNVNIYAAATTDLLVGAVDVTAGASGDVSIGLGSFDESSVTVGNVTVHSGLASNVAIDVGTDGAIRGDVSVGHVKAFMDGGDFNLNVDATQDLGVASVMVDGANFADVTIDGDFTYSTTTDGDVVTHDVTVGNVDVALSADSTSHANVNIYAGSNSPDFVAGNLTVGDVSIDANVRASADTGENAIDLSVNLQGYSHGNLTLGDITLTSGSETSPYSYTSESVESSSVDIRVDISSTQLSGGTGNAGGDLTVGDVHATVGNGAVSSTLTNDAVIDINISQMAATEAGNLSVGAVTLEGGDFAVLDLRVLQNGTNTGAALGNLTVGDVSVTGGESAEVAISVTQTADSGSTMGDVTVGDVTVNVAQDSTVDIGVYQSITDWSTANVQGNLTVGDVAVVGGDNSHVSITIEQSASGESDTANSFGDVTVGDISVALSATGPAADNAGGSTISVNVWQTHWANDLASAGDVTVGDVSLALEDSGSIDLNISISGSNGTAGSLTVGDISLSGGDNVDISATVEFSNNTTGSMGNLAIGNVTIVEGADSSADFLVAIDMNEYSIDMGSVSVGDVSLTAGDSSSIQVTLSASSPSSGAVTIGDVTVGDVTASVGAGASVSVSIDFTEVGSSTNGNIGDIVLGDVSADVGVGGSFQYSASFSADESVGTTTAGAIDLSVAESGDASYNLNVNNYLLTGTVGDVAVGNIDITSMGTTDTAGGASASVQVSVSANTGNANLSVGNVTVDVQGTDANDYAHITLTADGDISIGDVTVSGASEFILDGNFHAGTNESYLDVNAGGDVSIGNVDFSGYSSDATIDLTFALTGGASVIGSANDDTITGNADANNITGGAGQDTINIGSGGTDTVTFVDGDSADTTGTADLVDGFTATDGLNGDLLDFGLVAGTGANTVVQSGFSGDFVAAANDALNNSGGVKYYIEQSGNEAWVAVNYGSGDADLVLHLTNVTGTLSAADIIG